MFGHYNTRRGVLSIAALVYPEIPVATLYMYSFCAGAEYAYAVEWIAKGSIMHLVIASCCQLIDLGLYLFANGAFCKLQLEKTLESCDARNAWFGVQVLLFFVVGVPIWYACANASRRYCRDVIRSDREKKSIIGKGTLDSASVDPNQYK